MIVCITRASAGSPSETDQEFLVPMVHRRPALWYGYGLDRSGSRHPLAVGGSAAAVPISQREVRRYPLLPISGGCKYTIFYWKD